MIFTSPMGVLQVREKNVLIFVILFACLMSIDDHGPIDIFDLNSVFPENGHHVIRFGTSVGHSRVLFQSQKLGRYIRKFLAAMEI